MLKFLFKIKRKEIKKAKSLMFWPGLQLPISEIAIDKNIKIEVISSYSTAFPGCTV